MVEKGQASIAAEKKLEKVKTFGLSERTLVIERRGILVGIEKALTRNGHAATLRLTKRPLERSLLLESGLNKVLPHEFQEIFVDWDFNEDISYIAVVLSESCPGPGYQNSIGTFLKEIQKKRANGLSFYMV
jgi:uncharacterized protein YbcI